MCDDDGGGGGGVRRRLPTTPFSVHDIMHSDDRPGQQLQRRPVSADERAPAVVRPWETQPGHVTSSHVTTYVRRLTAVALALYRWHHAVHSVSPLCALYNMTTSNFRDSLNANTLPGWKVIRSVYHSLTTGYIFVPDLHKISTTALN